MGRTFCLRRRRGSLHPLTILDMNHAWLNQVRADAPTSWLPNSPIFKTTPTRNLGRRRASDGPVFETLRIQLQIEDADVEP